jgi:hypothetical protein
MKRRALGFRVSGFVAQLTEVSISPYHWYDRGWAYVESLSFIRGRANTFRILRPAESWFTAQRAAGTIRADRTLFGSYMVYQGKFQGRG